MSIAQNIHIFTEAFFLQPLGHVLGRPTSNAKLVIACHRPSLCANKIDLLDIGEREKTSMSDEDYCNIGVFCVFLDAYLGKDVLCMNLAKNRHMIH